MKRECLVVWSLLVAAPVSAQVVRVSVSTAGAEANGPSGPPSISAGGRWVVFGSTATNLVAGDTNNASDIFLRDRDTDADGTFDEVGAVATTRISLGPSAVQADGPSTAPVITADGRYVAFVSAATNLVAGANGVSQIYRLDRNTGVIVRVSETAAGQPGDQPSSSPAISGSGDTIAFASSATNFAEVTEHSYLHIYVREIAADITTRLTPVISQFPFVDVNGAPTISADGRRVAYYCGLLSRTLTSAGSCLHDRVTGLRTVLGFFLSAARVSASGSMVVLRGNGTVQRQAVDSGALSPVVLAPSSGLTIQPVVSPDARYVLTDNAQVTDFDLGGAVSLGFVPGGGAFSADNRWLAVVSGTSTLLPGNADTNGVDDIFVIDLPDVLDADDDTMDDSWETLFGVNEPSADPDGDGRTNAQEEDAGTHPNGQVRRFLAEGATGTFFHTSIALANPSPTLGATAVLTFDRGDGTRIRRPIGIPAGRSAVVDAGAIPGLEGADVSTTVESDLLLGVQRSMTWGPSAAAAYGSHAESAGPAPSATWFLAEGSTVLGFDLYYLLQNPQATTTQATVRYLLPSGTTITQTYNLAPGSRTTIHVNDIAGLDETDVSGDITANAPIVVERAMYRGAPGRPFALGHASMGVTAAATSWFLAEGATGSFFDLYVLIANPGGTDATVQARYARPDGSTVSQTYTVRAHSRFSVYVDAIPGLEATSVATTLTSTNAVPIVAERAMYWPGGFFDYYEGHSSVGSTTTALNWIVSGGEHGGNSAAQTFVLIANTDDRVGEATVTTLFDRSVIVGSPPPPTTISLPANSRTTLPITTGGATFGVLVTSSGASPVQLVVESAVYRSADGVLWSSGSNSLGTPIP